MTASAEIWPLVISGIVVTYFWRALGTLLSARIDPGGAVFQWISCVSYAMLAGLIARMTIMPFGALASVPLADRLLSMACAFIVFFALRRSILLGVCAGVLVLMALTILRGFS